MLYTIILADPKKISPNLKLNSYKRTIVKGLKIAIAPNKANLFIFFQIRAMMTPRTTPNPGVGRIAIPVPMAKPRAR